MGNVIPFHGDPHEATQRLLPWYVTGTLEPGEQRLVDDHLAGCETCRAELAGEQRLRGEVAALPAETPGEWAALRARAMAAEKAAPKPFFGTRRGLAAMAAAQVGILALGIAAYDRLRPTGEPEYHALGTQRPAAAGAAGNIIVIFRPDTGEQSFRTTLQAVGARLVDGPTAAGAYVLSVGPERRDAVVKDLQARADIVLAQPIDPEAVR